MADIFLSYSSQDRERVRPLIQSLEQQGWSVWWDRRIPPGKTWRQVIQQALDEARCVVIVWSNNSIGSDWVITEAEEGQSRGVLIPAMIDDGVCLVTEQFWSLSPYQICMEIYGWKCSGRIFQGFFGADSIFSNAILTELRTY